MRIACIHIPQFALQCATRLDPSLRGAPVAVVSGVVPASEPGRARAGGVLHAPIVLACSRAAWALGVRLGMTATAARGVSPELKVVTAEGPQEREAVRAVADSLLALTDVVDTGGRVGAGGAHLAMYAEVPAKTRGTSFGDRLLDMLDDLGFSARIGIADDRFTAWVAAAHSGEHGGPGTDDHRIVSVPRGGSAAFLAPRPLSLLAITPEVQHMLEALGVRTLGEFAALPAPSIARPFEADYQGLARGESGAQLRAYVPEAPIREEVIVSAGNVLEIEGSVGGTAAIAIVARRIALRLAGRGRAAARLEVAAIREVGDGVPSASEIPLALADHALITAEDIARALGPVLEANVDGGDETAGDGAGTAANANVQAMLPYRAANANAKSTASASANGSGAPAPWRLRVVVAGEQLLTASGEVAEVFAEGSSPFTRVAEPARGFGVRQHPSDDRPSDDRLSDSGTISSLAVVLASTGSLFALSPPDVRGERRDAHRRTRRGKQRRTRPTAPMQPRLFDRSSSK